MIVPDPLPRSFFTEPTLKAARDLLGKTLVRRFSDGTTATARIVETEAYTTDDPACHAFRGKTPRNQTMFGPPGFAYIHLNYGLHFCLNAVTNDEGMAEAVLIRAVEPLNAYEQLWQNYFGDAPPDGTSLQSEKRLGAGPGRLSKAFGIDRTFDGTDLCDAQSPVYVADGLPVPDSDVVTTTRIGITKGADFLWRWYVRDSPFVSKRCR